MFVKIHEQIFDSSIMEEDVSTRYVWQSLLILSDREGFIDKIIPAIARRIAIPEEIVRQAIEKFCQPDPKSRTPENEGRRLEPIRESFGWKIINYCHYRDIKNEEDKREYKREYMREKREKDKLLALESVNKKTNKSLPLTDVKNVSLSDAVSISDADAPSDSNKKSASPSNVESVISLFNSIVGTKYTTKTKDTNTMIENLFKKGHTLADFEAVIVKQFAKWQSDPKMIDFLRPATLFRASKFEGYLNSVAPTPKKKEAWQKTPLEVAEDLMRTEGLIE